MTTFQRSRITLLIALALLSTPAISQDMLYGLTRFGGQHNKGVLYQIRTTGLGYLSYKDFDGNPSDRPGYWSRLTQLSITPYPFTVGNSFAGLTEYGNIADFGADVGSRFDFRVGNAGVSQGGRLYFGGEAGTNPTGGLLSAFGMFYGTIPNGGVNNDGVLYAVQQIFGNGQQPVGHFHGPVTGRSPKGTPILASNGALYGMTEFGGSNDVGVIYKFSHGPIGLSNLLDFDGTARGANPTGDLLLASDNRLYGMTSNGGTSGNGVIFSVALDGSDFIKLMDFNGTNGAHPAGSLVEFTDGKLYGMTRTGGAYGHGVVFSITRQGQYTLIADFNGVNGQRPYGDLLVDPRGTALYGVTYEGGANGVGVLFKVANGVLTKLSDFEPSKGSNPVGTLSMVRKFPTVNIADLTRVELYNGAFSIPVEATGSSVFFISDDESTLEVNGNQLIPKKAGGVRVKVFQLGNAEYLGSFREVMVDVIKSKQTIQFAQPADKKYGDAPFPLTAIASSGLGVTFFSSDQRVAVINDNILTIKGAGIASITAMQEGNEVYEPAERVTHTLYVNKIDQTITIEPIDKKVCCDYFSITARSTSGLPVKVQVDATMVDAAGGTYVKPIKAGKSEIRLYQQGDRNYNSAEVRVPLEVVKGQGTIMFDLAADATFGSASPYFYLHSNGGASSVTSNPAGIAAIENGQIHILGVGTTTLTVKQQEDSRYFAAPPVSRTITVHPPLNNPTNNIITWLDFNTYPTLAHEPFNLIAWSSSGLPVKFESSDPQVVSIDGHLVTVHSEGTAVITAKQPGSATIPAATQLTRTITVSRATQELLINVGPSITMDSEPIQLFPYSSAGLPITYEVSDPSMATVDNYYLTIHRPGSFTLTASQDGNATFLPAFQSISTYATQTYSEVTLAALPTLTYGDSPVLIRTHSASSIPVVVTSSDPNIAEVVDSKLIIRNAGQFTLRAALNSSAFISETSYPVEVHKASQQLTTQAVGTKKFGDAPFRLQATSTSGLPVKVTSLSPVVSVTNNVVSIVGSGEAQIQLEQPGDDNHEPATLILKFDVANSGNRYDITGTSLEGAAGNSGAVFSLSADGTLDYIKQYPERTAPSPAAGFIRASDGKYYGLFRQGGIANGGQLVVMTDAFAGATSVYEFTAQTGIIPAGNVFEGSDGFFYGATTSGGEHDLGTLYKVAKNGADFSVLYSFSNPSGFSSGGLIQATNGLLYGTTSYGGPLGYGTIYSIRPDGSDFKVLHDFAPEVIATIAFNSSGDLIQGPDGSLYGTRMYGANSYGNVYKINVDGTGFTVLKEFNDALVGIRPGGSLMFASDGRIYGTTFGGGSYGFGTIYSLLPSGAGFTQHFSFDGPNGKSPYSKLTEGTDGRLYGTTYIGGGNDHGTIFAVGKDGSGFTKLYDLDTRATHPRFGPLVESTPGVFFGTAEHGGALNSGAVFRVTTSGSFDIFCHCKQGEFGPRELIEDPSGTYWYGVTRAAIWNQGGTIFRISKDTRQYEKIVDIPQGETISTLFYASTGHIWVAGERDNINFIRRMNPDGTNVQLIPAYDDPANRQDPPSSFVELSNGTIIGVSWRGYDGARLFSIKNDGTGYRTLRQLQPYYYVQHPLLLASDGNVYLASGQTSILRVTPEGTITSIYERNVADGQNVTEIIEMNDGRLAFATTDNSSSGRSTIFSVKKDGSGYFRIFQPESGQGTDPMDMKQSVDGWLYVMSSYDGVFYRIRPDGSSYETIRDFDGSDLSKPEEFMFNKTAQQLTFAPMKELPLNSPDFFPEITTSSGAPVVLTSSNPEVASIKDGLVTLHKTGSTTITARLPANVNYYDGGSASQTLVVTRGTQVISFDAISEMLLTAPDFLLNASSSSGLDLTFVSTNPAVASIDGSTVSIHAVGSTTIIASQPGNENFFPATPVSQTLTVAPLKDQTITFDQLADKTFGMGSFKLVASTTSALPLTFTSSSDNVILNGNEVQMLAPGQVIIVASQPGNEEYVAAPVVTRSFCINPVRPTITEDNALSEIQLISSSDTGNQWFLANQPLSGATTSVLIPVKQGSYTVQVTVGGCRSEISESHHVLITEVEEWTSSVEVYPNPVAEKLMVDLGKGTSAVKIVLTSSTGVPIKTINASSGGSVEINMDYLPAGMYLLQVENQGQFGRYKVIKQ